MLIASTDDVERAEHPVDAVEQLAAANGLPFDRGGDDEILMSITGGWTDYHIAFTWLPELETLHVSCAFELRPPERRRSETEALMRAINERLWAGHFDFWVGEGVLMHRQALSLAGGAQPTGAQCAALLDNAVETCERYYQAFQFVLWAGKTAGEALETLAFETKGEA